MVNRYYSIENLWVIHKMEKNFRESFICQRTEKGYVELFSHKLLNLEKGRFYVTPLVKYYSLDIRITDTYQDLISLLQKFNEINYFDFIRFYDSKKNYRDNLQFVCDSIKWYDYELLKKYNLNQLYIIDLLDNKDNLFMCRYNKILRKFVDIFTGEKIIPISEENIKSLIKYLNLNNLECNYKNMNVYSLLKLYIRLNYINKFLIYDNLDELVINKLQDNKMYEKSIIYKQRIRRVTNER